MKSARLVLTSILILVLSHVSMNAGQQGQGGWGGGSAGTWSSASNAQSGQPGNNQMSYGYGGVDANGVPYGSYGGNGGYHVNITDDQGRQHVYSGGQGGFAGQPGQPGQTGSHSYAGATAQPGQPGYGNTYTYANSNTNSRGQMSSSSSAYATAWNTFYVICLFSLFLIIKA